MGNHRAERGSRRTASEDRAPRTPRITRNASQGGARRATADADRVNAISGDAHTTTIPRTAAGKRAARPATEETGTFRFPRFDTGTLQAVAADLGADTRDVVSPTQGHAEVGRRRATRHSGSRGPLFKGLPSAPILGGVAALAVSIGGALAGPGLTADHDRASELSATSAVAPASSELLADRDAVVSRDHRRAAATEASEAKLLAEAEKAAAARGETLTTLNKKASKQAAKIEANRWHVPVKGYRLTATFGLSSYLWSTVHTGLDFAGAHGSPLMAVANGTITEAGGAGAYGTRTILTLEDGTEIWYCHQSSVSVRVGDKVVGGQVIGALGTTGNSTGPHLHLEVRPGGGDPVDPHSTLVQHGVHP